MDKVQVVLTAGLEMLPTTATEATTTATGRDARVSATATGPKETSGASLLYGSNIALACIGSIAAVLA